jgi:hypothetical protein
MDPGPASIVLSWQSAIDSIAIVAVVSVVKRFMEAVVGGKEKRKKNRWFTLILTALPIILGVLMAIFVPIRPAWLESYARLKAQNPNIVYGTWGICVGLLSGSVYHQIIRRIFPHDENSNNGQSLSVTPPP